MTSQQNRMTSSSKHDSLNSARSASTLDSVTENSSNDSSPVHDQSADKKQPIANQSSCHTNLQANQSMSRSQSSISKTTVSVFRSYIFNVYTVYSNQSICC